MGAVEEFAKMLGLQASDQQIGDTGEPAVEQPVDVDEGLQGHIEEGPPDAVEQAVEEPGEPATQQDMEEEDVVEDWVRDVVQQLQSRGTVDLTKIPAFREAQSSWERQKQRLARENRELKAQLEALQAQVEAQRQLSELEQKLASVKSPEEAAQLVRDFYAEQVKTRTAEAQMQAAVERLKEWDAYYIQDLNIPADVVERLTLQTARIFEQRGIELSPEAMRAFHDTRHALIEAWLQTNRHGAVEQQAAPQVQQKQEQPPKRRTPRTVVPRQGVVGDADPLSLFAQGRWDDLRRLLR